MAIVRGLSVSMTGRCAATTATARSYATLERRRVVALLPDREIATVEAWLADHPEIEIVSRDRGGGYREAAARVRPRAIQVADR